MKRSTLFTVVLAASAWIAMEKGVSRAEAALSPEQDTLSISKKLKPIPDDQWSAIAGPRIGESYQIAKGDTLFDISKRLFGDGRYWPKIWALNNKSITNPHQINPGNLIAFMPGSGSALPAVAINSANQPDVPNPIPGSNNGPNDAENANTASSPARANPSGISEEWKTLPSQPWELFSTALPKDYDASGFSSKNRIRFKKNEGIDLQIFAATHKIQPVGEIIAARTESTQLSLDDTVYIQPAEEIQIGQTFIITRKPMKLSASQSDRDGLAYPSMGRVKIIATRDDTFVGRITECQEPIHRGAILIPNVPKAKEPALIPGPQEMDGILMTDPRIGGEATAQHEIVFIDRGSEDSVQPGMVFRAYQHYDPSTDEKISSNNFIVLADAVVVQVSEQFSTAVIINGKGPVAKNTAVKLLTDLSSLGKNAGESIPSTTQPKPPGSEKELNEIDRSDVDGGLGKDEEKELQQLEKWKKNKEGGAPAEPLPGDGLPGGNEPSPAPAPSPAPEASPPANEAVPAPETAPAEEPPAAPEATPAPETAPAPENKDVPSAPSDDLFGSPSEGDSAPAPAPEGGGGGDSSGEEIF